MRKSQYWLGFSRERMDEAISAIAKISDSSSQIVFDGIFSRNSSTDVCYALLRLPSSTESCLFSSGVGRRGWETECLLRRVKNKPSGVSRIQHGDYHQMEFSVDSVTGQLLYTQGRALRLFFANSHGRCPLCAFRYKKKGRKPIHDTVTMQDKRRMDQMEYEQKEYEKRN